MAERNRTPSTISKVELLPVPRRYTLVAFPKAPLPVISTPGCPRSISVMSCGWRSRNCFSSITVTDDNEASVVRLVSVGVTTTGSSMETRRAAE